jgi:hypothetical protein
MAKKKIDSSVFEIVVVLAIVFIVAFTGQILISFGSKPVNVGTSDMITGQAVAEGTEQTPAESFLDVGIKNIEVNPPSPVVGEPFEIKIIVANEGFVAINEPFYVKAEITPNGEDVKPAVVNSVVTNSLKPGEESAVSFKIALVSKEGPVKIIATADSTVKLDDKNSANNQRSKTIIISSQ